jgi:hypothetical protein
MLVLLFSTVKVMYQFRPNIGWGTFCAIFFTNSSGHPVQLPISTLCSLDVGQHALSHFPEAIE